MSKRLGIDIGGTFTDFVLLDEGGEINTAKIPSDPENLRDVIMSGLGQLAGGGQINALLDDIDIIVHGTTIATNALIQGKMAKTGVICTKGFRDVLEHREGLKEQRYDYTVPPPDPLVPRALCLSVNERITKDGAIYTALDEADVHAAIASFKRAGVEAVAICLLWSIVNPSHEQRIKDMVTAEMPGVPVFISAAVSPQLREYPRFSTTVLCAALSLLLRQYIESLEENLATTGFTKAVRYIQCNGGTTSGGLLKDRPVLALDSGPAAGPAAGLFFGRLFDVENIVVLDMGGTSLDVSLVHDGVIETARNLDVHRYRVSLPMVNVRTLGAGGGSIAWIDDIGMLQVGPQSAEAFPGPACYGRGGEDPTVTDANVVLGYFSADYLLGGAMKIDGARSAEVMAARLAVPLGISISEAALAMFTVVNENMANAVRQISTEQGYDLRDFAFVCGGGCSPAHAARIAESVNVDRVIIPRVSSLLCSFGAVIADVRHDYSHNYVARFADCDVAAINGHFDDMAAAAMRELAEEGFSGDAVVMQRSLEIRYSGELGELTVEIPDRALAADGMAEIRALFDQAHERTYTFADPDSPCELMGLGLVAHGVRRQRLDQVTSPKVGTLTPAECIIAHRQAYFAPDQATEMAIYDGGKLKPGSIIDGPAVIEEETTTILIPPNWRITLEPCHAWLMTRAGGT